MSKRWKLLSKTMWLRGRSAKQRLSTAISSLQRYDLMVMKVFTLALRATQVHWGTPWKSSPLATQVVYLTTWRGSSSQQERCQTLGNICERRFKQERSLVFGRWRRRSDILCGQFSDSSQSLEERFVYEDWESEKSLVIVASHLSWSTWNSKVLNSELTF